jgi:hypothetical protein
LIIVLRLVMLWSVRGGMPVRPSSARTSFSGMVDSIALPTPLQWAIASRPPSVNIRIARGDGTWAT